MQTKDHLFKQSKSAQQSEISILIRKFSFMRAFSFNFNSFGGETYFFFNESLQ